jgi:hypothetical protein
MTFLLSSVNIGQLDEELKECAHTDIFTDLIILLSVRFEEKKAKNNTYINVIKTNQQKVRIEPILRLLCAQIYLRQ